MCKLKNIKLSHAKISEQNFFTPFSEKESWQKESEKMKEEKKKLEEQKEQDAVKIKEYTVSRTLYAFN